MATKDLGGHGNSVAGLVVESGRFNWAINDLIADLEQVFAKAFLLK